MLEQVEQLLSASKGSSQNSSKKLSESLNYEQIKQKYLENSFNFRMLD